MSRDTFSLKLDQRPTGASLKKPGATLLPHPELKMTLCRLPFLRKSLDTDIGPVRSGLLGNKHLHMQPLPI